MPNKQQLDIDLLAKVVRDLEQFLPHLVLVGGWVPLLYVHFLWEAATPEPLMTMDIDFCLKNQPFRGKETIAHCVVRKNYGERHLKLGKEIPFVPIVRLQNRLRAEVEFISDPDTSNALKKKLLGKEILVSVLRHMNLLSENHVSIKLAGLRLNIPRPAYYVFHKLLTFVDRISIDKQGKDLYYAYFILRFHPDGEAFRKSILELIKNQPTGGIVSKNIQKYFEDDFSKGPNLIYEASKMTSLATFGIDIRRDTFLKIGGLSDV